MSNVQFIIPPNYSQIPNIVLDYWMMKLDPASFKVLVFMCRKTFGWHKIKDCLSLSKIEKGTNLSRPTVVKSIRLLESNGLLKKTQHQNELGDQDPNTYELIIHDNPEEVESENEEDEGVVKNFNHVVKDFNQGVVKDFNHGVVKNFNPQKKYIYTKENNNNARVVFYSCLSNTEGLSDDEKSFLQQFPEDRVKLALEFAKVEPPKTSLIQLLTWHCKQEKPPKPSETKSLRLFCKKMAQEYSSSEAEVEVYEDEIHFISQAHPVPTRLNFENPDAKEKILNLFKKYKFKKKGSNSNGNDPNSK